MKTQLSKTENNFKILKPLKIMKNNIFLSVLLAALFSMQSIFAGTVITDAFEHTATTTNTTFNYTRLSASIPATATLIVTQHYGSTAIYNPNEVGVWYTGTQWAIFNQNRTNMPIGAKFHVMVVQNSPNYTTVGGFEAFSYMATPAQISGHIATIDNPLTNGKPNAVILVTARWGGSSSVYNTSAVGLWYDAGKWKLFNQDFSPMPANAQFNIVVIDRLVGESFNMTVFPAQAPKYSLQTQVHTTSSANTSGHITRLGAFSIGYGKLFATPVWIGTYDVNSIGMWHNGSGYTIYHQNRAAMASNLRFNVLDIVTLPW